jgi:WD40 repeat protein
MPFEFNRIDRVSLPMGIMDLAVRDGDRDLFAACMDGIYQIRMGADDQGDAAEKTDRRRPEIRRIGRHASYVSGVSWASQRNTLITTAYDGTLHFRQLAEGQDRAAEDSQSESDSQSEDDSIAVLADEEIAPSLIHQAHSFWSWGSTLSPDQKWVASVSGQYLAGAQDYTPQPSAEPTVKIFDAVTGELVHAWEMLPSVQCVAFDPSSRFVVAGNLMGDLCVWDVQTGETLAQWRTPSFTSWGIIKSHCYIGGIFAVAFAPDGESVYAAGMGEMRDPMAGNGKQLWQRFSWRSSPVEKIQETAADQSGEGLMETLAWSPDGAYFVMAGRLRGGNWNLGMFETASGQLVSQAKTGMRITTARFSQDGQHLWLGGMQGQPGPKEGNFPDFGYLERYRLTNKG